MTLAYCRDEGKNDDDSNINKIDDDDYDKDVHFLVVFCRKASFFINVQLNNAINKTRKIISNA